ncbi:hypothetical protein J2Z69_001695 [Paenibacillus shirakamiensis]|uniref:LamG-like jellyroll fold domain-containing protein n=2 Tax=Paenibacillus shirakamiensis TaxID=1265935 RepID=A0ABS4JG22_9BACL|nr:hypothetical protein [Paenibacillus shirakamiensis]
MMSQFFINRFTFLFRLVLAALLVWIPTGIQPALAAGTSYYVDCSANGEGNGTSSSPINSLNAVNALTLSPGDSVLFKRGSSCSGSLSPQGNGSASQPIVIGSYGTSSARSRIDASGQEDAVKLRNLSYVTVQDLELTASGDNTLARRGVHVLGQDAGELYGIRLNNLYIHDVRGYMPSTVPSRYHGTGKYANASGGIVVEVLGSSVPTAFHGVTIENNIITAVDRQGIYVWSNYCQRAELAEFWGSLCTSNWKPATDVTIQNNILSDVGGDGIAPMTVDGSLVQNNKLSGFNVRSQSPNAGMWTANANHVTFQYNEASGGKTTSDGMGFDVDHSTSNVIFQYNYSHENEGGFFLLCPQGKGKSVDFIIRYNVSVNDRARLFQSCGGEIRNGQIYNNTIYSGDTIGPVIYQESSAQTQAIQFRNNLLYKEGSGNLSWTLNDTTFTVDHNVFFRVPDSTTPAGTNTITSDPLLVHAGGLATTDYKLTEGSPALGAGAIISANGGRDYFGNAVSASSPPNIGAYQGAGLSVPLPVPLASYHLDATSGASATDSSGGSYNGTLIGGPVWNASGGASAGFLQLDGVDDYILLPPLLNPASGDFTITGWVKLGAGAGSSQIIVQQEGSSGRSLLYRDTASGKLGTYLGNAALLSSATIPTGAWTHIALIKKGTTISLYINGQPDASASRTAESESSGFRLGSHKSPTSSNVNFRGGLDEFRIYGSALSSTQIVKLYNDAGLQ